MMVYFIFPGKKSNFNRTSWCIKKHILLFLILSMLKNNVLLTGDEASGFPVEAKGC